MQVINYPGEREGQRPPQRSTRQLSQRENRTLISFHNKVLKPQRGKPTSEHFPEHDDILSYSFSIKSINLNLQGVIKKKKKLIRTRSIVKVSINRQRRLPKASWLLEPTRNRSVVQHCVALTPSAHACLALKGEELISLFLPFQLQRRRSAAPL